MTKLWVNGRATEDKEEWCEEVRLHCEKSYDDKSETPVIQAERIKEQRCRGDSAVAEQGRRVQITVNRALRARGKMLRGKSNGPADCLVVEMLLSLLTEVICEVTHWFQKRFQGECRAPEAWRSLTQGWRRGFVVSVRLLCWVCFPNGTPRSWLKVRSHFGSSHFLFEPSLAHSGKAGVFCTVSFATSSDVAVHAAQRTNGVGDSQWLVPGDPRSQATFCSLAQCEVACVWDYQAELHSTTGQVASGALQGQPRGGVGECQEACLWIGGCHL